MWPAKLWSLEAILRLVLGVIISLSLGSIAAMGLHYDGPPGPRRIIFFGLLATAILLLAGSLLLISRPWRVEVLLGRLLLLLGSLFIGLSLAAAILKMIGSSADASAGERMVVTETVVLLFLIAFLRGEKVSWSRAFGLSNRPRHAVLSGIVVACVFLPLAEGLQIGTGYLMTALSLKPHEQEAVHALRVTTVWSDRLSLALLALVLAPVVEEIFFRGIFYPAIRQAGFPRLALWGLSLVFALIHANVVTFIPLFVLAVVLTLLYERSQNLLASISAHALFNGLNFALLYLFPPGGS
jgi:membrane protease YdiL (CAAX protease family)